MRSELFSDVMQHIVVIRHRRVGTTYRSPLKMGSIGCPETSVRNYHHSLRNIPEQRTPRLFRGGSLKSREGHTRVKVE